MSWWGWVGYSRDPEPLPDCEGWTCQSCGADNFIPVDFARVIPPVGDAS